MSEEGESHMALKVLHTADWHLGMRFPSFPDDDQRTLTRARMSVIDRIFGLAQSNRVDAVLCAGDLFDDPRPDDVWWEGLLERLAAHDWSEVPVVLLPGNHDPLTPTSVYHPSHPFRARLPPGVHVVDRDDFELSLGPDAVLHAVPCRSHAGQMDLCAGIPPRGPGDERIRIGLVHGQTFDIPGFKSNFPIRADAASACGLDYLAIGDTHAFREVPPGAAIPTVYPSAPEPTKFGELDAGYVALVFFPLGRRRALVRRERVGQWGWEEHQVTSFDALRRLADRDDLRRCVVRLRLDFSVSPPEYERVEQTLRALRGTDAMPGRVGVLQVDREGLRLDTRDVEAVFGDLPEVFMTAIERLRTLEDGDQRDIAKRALYHLYTMVREQR